MSNESIWHKLYHELLYVLAFIVVFCAIVFTVTRAMTPFVNMHRPTFEKWTSELIGAKVRVNHVAFGWRGIEPEMLLKGVKIYKKGTNIQLLNLKRLYIALDVVKSVEHREFLPSLIVLSGAKVSVKQLPHGGYMLNDLMLSQQSKVKTEGIDSQKIVPWLLLQNHVSLQHVEINYYNIKKHFYPLRLDSLNLINQGNYHQLSALLQLRHSPSKLNFVLQSHGDLKNKKHLKAALYVKAQNVNLANWLKSYSYLGYQLKHGSANVELWMNWNKGHWGSQEARVHLFNLNLYSQIMKESTSFKAMSADLTWQPSKAGWNFSANDINVISPQYVWPKTQLLLQFKRAKKEKNDQLNAWLNYAEVGDVRQFVQNSSLLPIKTRNLLARLAFAGSMRNIRYEAMGPLRKPSGYHLSMDVNQLSFNRWHHIPKANHLSGHLSMNPKVGDLTIDSNNVDLDFGALFNHPLNFSKITGDLHWQKEKEGAWMLQAQNLMAVNDDLGLHGQLAMLFNKGEKAPYISLLAGAHMDSPTLASHYLPVSILPKKTVAWLKQAFVAGGGLTSKVILRGNMANFPFDKKPGVFQVDTKLKHLNLRFAKDWPEIKNINADLLFADQSMSATVSSASLYHANVQNAKVSIPNLGSDKSHLLVDFNTQDDAADLFKFIASSPLKDSVGKALGALNLAGPIKLKLHLDVPLHQPEQTFAKGGINFEGNILKVLPANLILQNVQGQLGFTNDTLNAKKLSATLFGSPITAELHTLILPKKNNVAELAFQSAIDTSVLWPRYPWLKTLPVKGKTTYTGILKFHMGANAPYQDSLQVQSDLYGIHIGYPAPFGKPWQAVKKLSATVLFGLNKPTTMRVSYGKTIDSATLIKTLHGKTSLYSTNIRFGGKRAVIPKAKGLIIDGWLAKFDWKDWAPLLKQNKTEESGRAKAIFAKLLNYADLHIKRLSAFGVHVSNSEIKLSHADQHWAASIVSAPMQGSMQIPDQFPRKALQANFQRVYLPKLKLGGGSAFNPANVPPFYFHANDFQYDGKDFGNTTVSITPKSNGFKLNTLKLASAWIQTNLSGHWYQDGSKNQTAISGSIASNDFAELMNILGIKSNLIANSGLALVHLSWPDTPYHINLKKLSGDAYLKLKDGWIIGLSKSTAEKLNLGRAITMLSVRHLLFQVNDLERASGYSFDSLTGHFDFDNGIVSTQDLYASGAVADLHAKGKINLVQKSIDMKLGILVNAGASLPVIATVATGFNPIVGAVTWIADKIVHKALNDHVHYGYQIIGPWDKPKVVKL